MGKPPSAITRSCGMWLQAFLARLNAAGRPHEKGERAGRAVLTGHGHPGAWARAAVHRVS
jgi:hypothetical protein